MNKNRLTFFAIALIVACGVATALLTIFKQEPAVAIGKLEPAIVLKLPWGSGDGEVGFKFHHDGVRGPDTYVVDQRYFYIADTLNSCLKIFNRKTGKQIEKIDYPEVLKKRYLGVQQMLLVDKTLFMVCWGGGPNQSLFDFDTNRWKIGNDWGPPGAGGDGWSIIIYRDGQFKELDLAAEIPNFAGPFRLEQLPYGVMIRRDAPPDGWGNILDKAPFIAIVNSQGRLLKVKNQRFAGVDKNIPFYYLNNQEWPGPAKLKALDSDGKELKAAPVFEREKVNAFYRGIDQKGNVYIGVKPVSFIGTNDFYIVVFDRKLNRKGEYHVTFEKERPYEYPPAAGDSITVTPDGEYFDMAFRKDGFVIYQLLPVRN